MSQQRIVILRETDAERYLAIWVGIYEAEHLTIALQEVEAARPLTYDLFKNIIDELNARVLRVEIVALKDATFYGSVVLEAGNREINIDARPSDALNLAVRAHVPILIAKEVIDEAGIIPEDDMSGQTPDDLGIPIEESEERLSIFEDFIDKLDLDKLGKDDEEE
jgi:bifunctional DNase/RNase